MATGFIWLHRDVHVRVPHFHESFLDDVHVPVRFLLLMRNCQVLCCHVHDLGVVWDFWCDAPITGAGTPHTSVLLALASSEFLARVEFELKKSPRGPGSKSTQVPRARRMECAEGRGGA